MDLNSQTSQDNLLRGYCRRYVAVAPVTRSLGLGSRSVGFLKSWGICIFCLVAGKVRGNKELRIWVLGIWLLGNKFLDFCCFKLCLMNNIFLNFL